MRLCGRDEELLAARNQKLTVLAIAKSQMTELEAGSQERELSSHQPHGPAGYDNATKEHHKTIKSVADHVASGFAVRNAENDGRKKREDKSRAEVSELDGHCFFPMAMW